MSMWDQFAPAPVAETGKAPTLANNPELALPDTGPNSGVLAGLQGEDYLAALHESDPATALNVRAIGEGRAPYPNGQIMRTPYGRYITGAINQAYPNMTASDFHTRQKTSDDFKSGMSARAVRAANQAILHANTALDASEKLGGLDTLPVLNTPLNAIKGQFSTDFQTHKAHYEGAIAALSTELAKSFAGKAPALAEIEHWRANSLAADSPTTRRANLQIGMKLLNGALESLVDQYNRGMLTNSEAMDLLAPHNREIMTRIMTGEKPVTTKTGGYTGKGEAASAPPAPGNYVYDPATKQLVPAK